MLYVQIDPDFLNQNNWGRRIELKGWVKAYNENIHHQLLTAEVFMNVLLLCPVTQVGKGIFQGIHIVRETDFFLLCVSFLVDFL